MAIEKPLVAVENYFVSYVDHRSRLVARSLAHLIKKYGQRNHIAVGLGIKVLTAEICNQIQSVADWLKIYLRQTPRVIHSGTFCAGAYQVVTRQIDLTNQTVSGTAVYHSAVFITKS